MLNGKGMVNCSEGYFLKVVWLGIGGCVMGNDFFQVFRRLNRYQSIE